MSELALAQPNGKVVAGEDIAKPVRDRVKQAKEWRRQFEGTWQLAMALAAGMHWQSYDRFTRTLRRVQDTDPRYAGRELYTADMVTEYRTTMLGELGGDNDRPQLLLQHDDQAAEQYEAQANRALAYGWDFEWMGDDVLAQIDRYMIDHGTAAVRCHFDGAYGPTKADNVPYMNGKPVLDMAQATSLLGQGPNPDVQMGAIQQGRIRWTPLSAFNVIVPPGVVHESMFPWECIVVPTLLSDVRDVYGPLAAELQEDQDIGSVLGTETSGSASAVNWAGGDGRKSRLRDHVWLYTYFERPTSRFPQGRVMVFAGNEMKLMDVQEQLPYKAQDGQYRSGIAYFHWWRVTGRFWSRGLVEAMMDGQKALNKRRTQLNEMVDRAMPLIMVEKDSKALERTGVPMEFVELDRQERTPITFTPSVPPWMQADVEAIREDIDHATGIKGPRLGENPAAVTTYSQLALINESEAVKREQIHRERRLAIKQLVEDSLYDIRTYWGADREIMLAGDDHRLQAETFNATRIPPFFILEIASGAAKPRSQAAMLKMIEDIFTAGINSQQPPPLSWLKDSLLAGEPLDLPAAPSDDQTDKAELENHLLRGGQLPPVAYYDRVDIHIPIHRFVQDQAMLTGDEQTWQLVEQHVQLHLQAAQDNAMKVQAQQQQQQQQQLSPAAAPMSAPAGAPPVAAAPSAAPSAAAAPPGAGPPQ